MANLIITDQPILEAAHDRYGFSDMAKLIAEDIAALTDARGTIIGIDGEWGSGKTSFTNLLLDHLRAVALAMSNDAEQPVEVLAIPSISAWKERDIVKPLLEAVQQRVVVETGDAGELARQAEAASGAMGKMGGLLTAGAAAADNLGFDSGPAKVVKDIGKALGAGLTFVGSAGQRAAAEVRAKQLADALERVSAMKASGQLRLILTIDDVDRLLADEMVRLFSQLRDIADESGVVVILPIASQSAAKLLDAATGGQGSAYLGKVLTNQFSVPEISRDARAGLLRDMVSDWIKPDDEFSWLNWSGKDFTAFEDWFVDHFVLTPRDFKRLEAAVRMRMRLQRDTLFVLDVVAVELARLFDGAAFLALQKLHENAERFYSRFVPPQESAEQFLQVLTENFSFPSERWHSLVFSLWLWGDTHVRRPYPQLSSTSPSSRESSGLGRYEVRLRLLMSHVRTGVFGRFWSLRRRTQFFSGKEPVACEEPFTVRFQRSRSATPFFADLSAILRERKGDRAAIVYELFWSAKIADMGWWYWPECDLRERDILPLSSELTGDLALHGPTREFEEIYGAWTAVTLWGALNLPSDELKGLLAEFPVSWLLVVWWGVLVRTDALKDWRTKLGNTGETLQTSPVIWPLVFEHLMGSLGSLDGREVARAILWGVCTAPGFMMFVQQARASQLRVLRLHVEDVARNRPHAPELDVTGIGVEAQATLLRLVDELLTTADAVESEVLDRLARRLTNAARGDEEVAPA